MSPSVGKTEATSWLRNQTRKIVEQTELAVTEQVASATQVEAWLQNRNVKYAPPTGIPMSMIEVGRSRANQARKDAIVSESVERFATAYRSGKSFPPIVVYQLGNKLVIIDGNNRHEAAARAKLEYIQGIVIDATTDGDLIQLLTVEANATHGVTPPLDWRIRQALHLVTLGHPETLAAEAAGVSLTQMRNQRQALEAEGRARAMRIHGFADLAQGVKQTLSVIKSDPVFLVAGKLAATQRFTGEQAKELVRELKRGRSEADQLAVVEEYARGLDVDKAVKIAQKRGISSPKNALASACGLFLKCDTTMLINQIVTAHDRDLIHARLQDAVNKILEIQIAMDEGLADLEEGSS